MSDYLDYMKKITRGYATISNRYFDTCKHCGGEGECIDPDSDRLVECPECTGHGYFFTTEGEELHAFLKKLKLL